MLTGGIVIDIKGQGTIGVYRTGVLISGPILY